MNPLWFAVPIVVGFCHPIILQMSVRVSRLTGEMESAIVLHIIGAAVGFLWFFSGYRGLGFVSLKAIPWWAYLAGAIGVTCLAATNRAMPMIGVAGFCAIAIASQLLMALAFDHFGLMGATTKSIGITHIFGAFCLVVGAICVTR